MFARRLLPKARAVRDDIKCEMANKLICLKIDGVTRQFRSFIGINAQYIINEKIIVRTLALKEVFDRHTSDNLKDLVLNVLKEYNLTADNIYFITTMIRLLREEQTNYDDSNDLSEMDDVPLSEYRDEFYLQGEQLFPPGGNSSELIGVRCVAHTLQLAIYDAIQAFEIQGLLQKIRELVRKLRCANLGIVLRNLNLRRPILDCTTRWNSTFNMLERLYELKDFCRLT